MSVLFFPSPRPLFEENEAAPSDAAQRELALDITRSWIVEAPAGSGKTGLLIQRFLKLLAVVNVPEAVMALTFTNKATAEMRDRIVEALRAAQAMTRLPEEPFQRQTALAAQSVLEQDRNQGWDLLNNPHRLNIRTIDSLCGEIARAVPVLSGGIGEADPLTDASALYQEAARAVFLGLGSSQHIKSGALRSVLLLRDGNLQDCELLLAQMLEKREQWGRLVPLSHGELTDDVLDREVLPVLNRTLNAVVCSALSELQRNVPPALLVEVAQVANLLSREPGYNAGPNPLLGCFALPTAPGVEATDLDHWKMLAFLLLTKDGGWRKGIAKNHIQIEVPKHLKVRLQELLEQLKSHDEARELLSSLNDLPPAVYPQDQWMMAKALFRLLRDALIELKLLFAERNVCDFTERSIAARAALAEPEGRNHVTHALGLRLQHLLVDEMQDTSASQYELLQDLTQGWQAPQQTVFLVGDPKQSIYLFRQARVERFIQGMHLQRLGDVPLGLLRLTANFRSGAKLIGSFNETFRPVFHNATDGVTYSPAQAPPSAKVEGRLQWHVDVLAETDSPLQKARERKRARREEAETVANLVSEWRARPLPEGRDQPWKIAVLVRSKHHAAVILQKLGEAGVPYRAVEMQHLNERPEVLDALALTRAIMHPADRVAWLAILRAPWCGIMLADLHQLAGGDLPSEARQPLRMWLRQRSQLLEKDERKRVLRTLDILDAAILGRGRSSVSHDVERAWSALDASLYTGHTEASNAWRYFDLLHEEEQTSGTLTLDGIMRRLRKLFAATDAVADAVDVMTIHKAKGLEWDMVLLPALERQGKRDNPPLLDWLELESHTLNGHPETAVMLAPVPARGDEAGSLNRFIQKARRCQEAAELKRLLYVAATRARTSLQLFATTTQTTTGFERRPNTLLQVVWDEAETHFEQARPTPASTDYDFLDEDMEPGIALAASAAAQTREIPKPSTLKRLPLEQILEHAFLEDSRSAEAEAAETTIPRRFLRPEGSFRARARGKAVHVFLDHLAGWIAQHPDSRQDLSNLLQEIANWHGRIHTLIRGLGLAYSEVEELMELVQLALTNTVNCKEGLWLLQPHQGAVSEAKLLGGAADQTSTYRMDRSFFAGSTPNAAGSDVLWIVEYKTDEPGQLPLGDFLEKERCRYEPQLRTYAELRLETLPAGTPVVLALFHPLLSSLSYWRYVPLEGLSSDLIV